MSCDICPAAQRDGHWTHVLGEKQTHCRDCHVTFYRSEHHCTRCHATFGGAESARKHDPTGLGTRCRDPRAYGCAKNERGVWVRSGPSLRAVDADQAARNEARSPVPAGVAR
jgi:hypothetical protein